MPNYISFAPVIYAKQTLESSLNQGLSNCAHIKDTTKQATMTISAYVQHAAYNKFTTYDLDFFERNGNPTLATLASI